MLSHFFASAFGLFSGNGAPVESVQLTGANGHWNGIFFIEQAAEKIKAFLTN